MAKRNFLSKRILSRIFSAVMSAVLIAAMVLCVVPETLGAEEGELRMNDEYIYSVLSGNIVSIVMYIGTDKDVVIPDAIEGYPVAAIADRAFYGSEIESVVIGNNVSRLGSEVFYNCRSLTRATIPRNVADIQIGLFRYCTRLEQVSFDDGMVRFGIYMFYGCQSLRSINIPSGVYQIPVGAFAYCKNLEQVSGDTNIMEIQDNAFMYCSLASFDYSPRLYRIGSKAFAYNKRLDANDAPTLNVDIAEDAYLGCLNNNQYASADEFEGPTNTTETYPSPPTYIPSETTSAFIPCTTAGGAGVTLTEASIYTEPPTCTEPAITGAISCTGSPTYPSSELVPYYAGDISLLERYEEAKTSEVDISNRYYKQYLLSLAYDARLRGDANGDGKVNIKDATQIQKYVAGIVGDDAKDFVFKNADADANGKVNIKDATLVQKIVAGLV